MSMEIKIHLMNDQNLRSTKYCSSIARLIHKLIGKFLYKFMASSHIEILETNNYEVVMSMVCTVLSQIRQIWLIFCPDTRWTSIQYLMQLQSE